MSSEAITRNDLTAILNEVLPPQVEIADYVVEQGTSGIWNYRKWSSGIAECWCLNAGIFNINTQYGSDYYAITSVDFPTAFFIAEPRVNITRQGREGNGLVFISPYTITESTLSMFIVNCSFAYNNAPIGYSVHAIGKWK